MNNYNDEISDTILDEFLQGLSRASETKNESLEVKKKYIEIVSNLEDKAMAELKKENNLLPIRELDIITSMMANVIKF